MNNTTKELLDLLQLQEELRTKQRTLRRSYLQEKGKKATATLRERVVASDKTHEVMRRIAVLSLNLMR